MTPCPSGKRRFKDEIAAALALTKIQKKDNPRLEKNVKRFYRCPECRGFHLTSRGRNDRG